MRFLSLLRFDIKRLIGNGRIVLLALLVPLVAVLLFVSILLPAFSAKDGISIAYGIVNEEEHDLVHQMVNLFSNSEAISQYGEAYPVSDLETGIEAIDDGDLDLLIHIPENFYGALMEQRPVTIEVYYPKKHAMETDIIVKSLQSCFSIYGQSEVLVAYAGDLMKQKGIPEETRLEKMSEEYWDLFYAQVGRGKVLGWDTVLSPAGFVKYEYYLGVVFSFFSLFAAFPVLYLTSADMRERFRMRRLCSRQAISFYFARLLSGSLLVLCSFAVMLPIAAGAGFIKGIFSPAFLPAVLLTALCFSSLLIFLSLLAKEPDHALWIAFYVTLGCMVFGILIPDSAMPSGVDEILRWIPIRPVISLLTNTIYSSEDIRIGQDFLRLSVDTGILTALGALLYRRKGEGV